MDYDSLPCDQRDPGLCTLDREVFERVWRRVMPEDAADCPIALSPPPAPPMGLAPTRVEVPQAPAPEPGGSLCLEDGAPHGGLLQAFITHELADANLYRALARTGSASRILTAIAQDEMRHARRLSAAYFLISGVRFLPPTRRPPTKTPFWGTLREQFWCEQRGARAYADAAADCPDACLREVYLELAEDEKNHAHLLWSILETM